MNGDRDARRADARRARALLRADAKRTQARRELEELDARYTRVAAAAALEAAYHGRGARAARRSA